MTKVTNCQVCDGENVDHRLDGCIYATTADVGGPAGVVCGDCCPDCHGERQWRLHRPDDDIWRCLVPSRVYTLMNKGFVSIMPGDAGVNVVTDAHERTYWGRLADATARHWSDPEPECGPEWAGFLERSSR